MKYALIQNGKVTQVDIEEREGFIEVSDSIVCGMLYDAETGEFSNPPPRELSWSEKRLQEYPTLQECINAILDGGQQLTDLQSKRQEIKLKYPKQ